MSLGQDSKTPVAKQSPRDMASVEARVWEQFIAHPSALPKLSGHNARVLAMAGKIMTADIAQLMALVRADPTSVAELLRMANSPLFARGAALTRIDEAIVRLGRREVYNVLTTVAANSLFRPRLQQLLALMPQAWYQAQHSAVCCAFASGWLARTLRLADDEQAFMLGLFGDIGRLGALHALGALVQGDVMALPTQPLAWVAARPALYTPMTPIMLRNWGLGEELIERAQGLAEGPAASPQAAGVLHVVALVRAVQAIGDSDGPLPEEVVHHPSRRALGLAESQLEPLQRYMAQVQDQVSGLLGAIA